MIFEKLEQAKKEYAKALTNKVVAKNNYENACHEEARLLGLIQGLNMAIENTEIKKESKEKEQ